MALDEPVWPRRDGTAQRDRARAELEPGFVRLDERTPAELIAFAQAYARHLLWRGPDGRADGDWSGLFEGVGPEAGPGVVSHAEAAAFAADPAAFADPRFDTLRRPHLALFLACIRLLRHGQDAVNAIGERHFDHHLRTVLGLAPEPARPDRAHVLFELAPNVAAAEVPAGLRLLAGRDARRRDRVYRLDDGLVVNRARVSRLATSFVDREVVDLAEARAAEPGTPDEKLLALLRLAYGTPRPGDPLPPLGGAPLVPARLPELRRLVGFGRAALFLELFELRALVERKRRRDAADGDWKRINATLEIAGRAKRGQPDWKLEPADPRDFAANLLNAYGGDPMVDNGLAEVATLDDLMLHLGRDDVRAFVKARLFLDVDRQFVPMMTAKRGVDADWRVVNGYLEAAGRRKRDDPKWAFAPPNPAAFEANLAEAVGPVEWPAAGTEARGAATVEAYLDAVAVAEGWFHLTAEQLDPLLAAFAAPDGDPAWRRAEARLAEAHPRHVRAGERAAMRALRERPPAGQDGVLAALAAAIGEAGGELPGDPLEALARHATPEEGDLVRAALDPRVRRRLQAADWDRVDAVLAEARRRRLELPEPVARREHWRALWADADPPASADAAGAWPAFGAIPADPSRSPATIGWAIASPALALSTGRRRIVLTLAFDDDGRPEPLVDPEAVGEPVPHLKVPFNVEISAGEAWLAATEPSFEAVAYDRLIGMAPLDEARRFRGLQIAFTLDESAPATAPPVGGFGGAPWPVLRLALRSVRDPATGRVDTAYERFRGLKLARAHVGVTVGGQQAGVPLPGLWPLVLETDAGPVDGKKPFEPFGAAPSLGAELALGHPDLANKRLGSLSLRLQWQGAPDFATHYANYPARDFRLQASLVDGRVRTTGLGTPLAMFPPRPNDPHRLGLVVFNANQADPVVEPLGPEVRGWRRHLVLALAGTDFGHAEYPALAAGKAIALAAKLRTAEAIAPADFTVKPPHTPRLKRIELDMLAVQEVELARYDRATAVDRLYHLHPFGVVEAPDAAERGWPLLPEFEEEGALHVGLDGVAAPQTLSLLFETRAAGGSERRPEGLVWSYLDAGGWVEFAEPPRDDTLGLARPGIVRFTLPPAAPDARMPRGPYWLRATLAGGAAAAADLVGVHAQAGAATFADEDAPPEHYAAPLPPGSIRVIADPAPGVARVGQPYPSRDGRPAEDDAAFRVRAGERLRHKQRAVSPWDYERLTLARFPQVHKVKCLPASLAGEGVPGDVRLIVIPDIRAQRQADPFAPRAPASLLDEVRDHLAPLAPPTARISVGHPQFVRVRVRLGVRFRNAGDEAFDRSRLNERLNRWLAPWAFDEGSEIAIGQRIDATSLVAFVDALPFVDFVGGCRLFLSEDGSETWRPGENGGEAVAATRPDAVLTPAATHEIDIIADDVFADERFTGIGYMKVELDFVVG